MLRYVLTEKKFWYFGDLMGLCSMNLTLYSWVNCLLNWKRFLTLLFFY